MKRKINFMILGISILLLMTSGLKAQKVFLVSDPTQANVAVFATTSTEGADLKVMHVLQADKATKDGLWFEVGTAEEAYIKIYVTENEGEAQIKIFYVEDAAEAGWITNDKRNFYKIGK